MYRENMCVVSDFNDNEAESTQVSIRIKVTMHANYLLTSSQFELLHRAIVTLRLNRDGTLLA